MKRLAKLIIALTGALSLTSCLSLLPTGGPRRKSESSIRSGDFSSGSGDYTLDGPRGSYGMEIGSEIWWTYSVSDNVTGEQLMINDYYVEHDEGIDVYDSLLGDSRLLELRVNSYQTGIYNFKITLTISSGESFTRQNRVIVDSNYFDNDIHVDYPCEVQITRESSFGLYFRAYDNRTGQNMSFDASHPYDIGYLDTQIIDVTNYHLEDDNRSLYLDILSNKNGASELDIKLVFNDGSTFNVTIFVFVRPDIWFECRDSLVVDYGESINATFEVYQYDPPRGQMPLDIDPNNLFIETNGGFTYEVVDFYDNKITLKITNQGYGDYGNLTIYYYDENGTYFEWGNEIISMEVFLRDRWVGVDFGMVERLATSTIKIYLGTRYGYATIYSLSIEARNDIIPDLESTIVNTESYEYTFIPYSAGYEELEITVVDENYNTFQTTVGIEIQN